MITFTESPNSELNVTFNGLFFDNASWTEMEDFLGSTDYGSFNDISIFAPDGIELTYLDIYALNDIVFEVDSGDIILDNTGLIAGNNIIMSAQDGSINISTAITLQATEINISNSGPFVLSEQEIVVSTINAGNVSIGDGSITLTYTGDYSLDPAVPEPISATFMGVLAATVCIAKVCKNGFSQVLKT